MYKVIPAPLLSHHQSPSPPLNPSTYSNCTSSALMSYKADAAEMECGTSLAEGAWAVPSIDDGPSSTKSSGNSTKSSSAEEAWSQIHELRSKLASDVISDPPSTNTNGGDDQHNFPTFISPYEQPKSSDGAAKQPKQSYKGMAIPLIYCDQTASQRPVASIEKYLREVSMPAHANTHTVRLE